MNKSIPNRPDQQVSHVTAHGCPAGTDHDREVPEVDLLSPLTIRGHHASQPDRDVPHVPVCRDGWVGQATGT